MADFWSDKCSNPQAECLCPNREISKHAHFSEDTFADDPQFQHLTRLNKFPTRREGEIILASVADLESRRAALQAHSEYLHALRSSYCDQISRIDAEIESQKHTEQLVEDAIRVRRRILSPVHRLPPEILQHIFLSTVEHIPERTAESDLGERWSFKNPECMLWTIELVCQQWRTVALNYPALWSYLSIRVPLSDDSTSTPLQLTRLAVQLDRAQLHTLSVVLYPGPTLREAPSSLPEYLIPLILPYARRIKTLDLILPYRHIRSLSLLAKRLSSLTDLSILNTSFKLESSISNPAVGEPASLFFQCTQLQTLSFVGVRSPSSRFKLPWHTITSLSTAYPYHSRRTCSGTSPRQVYHILQGMSKLQQCSFHVGPGSPLGLLNIAVLTVGSLQRLNLIFPVDKGEALLDLLEKLAFPSLISLHICTEVIYPVSWASPDVFTAIVNAIERWKCPLQKFKYHQGNVDGKDLARLVEVTKGSLSVLELNDLTMSKTDVALVIDHHCASDEIFLDSILENLSIPCLTTLRIRGDELNTDWANHDVFAALVKAVERSQCPLEELEYQRGFTEHQDVVRLVRATSDTLKSLSLMRITSYDMAIVLVDVLTALESSNEPLLAPHLHTLVLTGCVHRSTDYSAHTFSAKAYVDMVRSRCTEAPFRRLHIGWEPEFDECPRSDAVRELEVLQAEMASLVIDASFTYSIIEEEEAEVHEL